MSDDDYLCTGVCMADPDSGYCLGCGRPPLPVRLPLLPAAPAPLAEQPASATPAVGAADSSDSYDSYDSRPNASHVV